MARLLVVEDEEKVAAYLKKGLAEHGFTVDAVGNGHDALVRIAAEAYNLILLDIMLPGLDGFSVLKTVRSSVQTPVLMLTARDQIEDRVKGLQEGADDYLVKPFAFSELLARVHALLRRGQMQSFMSVTQLSLANLELDLVSRKVVRCGQRIDVTSKEFQLLTLLMQRRGQVLSRATLAEQVWDMSFSSGTNVVEVAVRRLRAKIDDPFSPKLLHNVRGMGYVLEDRS